MEAWKPKSMSACPLHAALPGERGGVGLVGVLVVVALVLALALPRAALALALGFALLPLIVALLPQVILYHVVVVSF